MFLLRWSRLLTSLPGADVPLPPLSDEDKQFIRAILANPAELTAWLAYADWLDEHDEQPRAEFVRLQVRFSAAKVPDSERRRIASRLEVLRPALDPNWVAVFDRPRIENCDELFAFKCPKKWEQLAGTASSTVRHCESCGQDVYYCTTLRDAHRHARLGNCITIATGVNRFPGDLHPQPLTHAVVTMGMPRPRPPAAPHAPEQPKRPWWKFW